MTPGTGDRPDGERKAHRWVGVTAGPLPLAEVTAWAKLPRCGAVVVFTGCVRDHSAGRSGVVSLEYEAYTGPARLVMEEIADEARRLWPELGRVAMIHRVGLVELSQDAVVVAASAPHREEAFETARYCIDAVKARVPIWKRERWQGGEDWGVYAGGWVRDCHHDGGEARHTGRAPGPDPVWSPA